LGTARARAVLITGGLGFIGSHIADAYLAHGREVTLVDSMVASVTGGDEYGDQPGCRVVKASVEEYFARDDALDGVERVVHAAAHVGPAGILRHAGRLGSDIVCGTAMVVASCAAHDVPLCVFSSAEVYGRSGELHEKDDIRVPTRYNARIEYAIAKTLTEAMTVNWTRRGVRAIVIRPFNVAGPRQSRAGGFVMPTFVQQALASRPITVFAGGGQTRAFLSVVDLARFFCDYFDDALQSDNRIYNLGNPDNATSILDLARRVKELAHSDSPIVLADAKTIHGPDYEEAESIDKLPLVGAAAEIGWEPRVGLDTLITQTIDYYRACPDMRGAHAPL